MTIPSYRYRIVATDEQPADADARLNERGRALQRRERDTNRPFIPLQLRDIENQWSGLIDCTRGKHPEMSAEAARAAHAEVARVFKFSPRAYLDRVRVDGKLRTVRRIAIENIGLNQCTCSGGAAHYDLDVDCALDAVKEVMQQVLDATDAEEAHNAAWAVDALITTLGNHGIGVNYVKLWREACPPLQRTIPAARLAAYQAWNARWRVVSELPLTDEVTVELDRIDRFRRAKLLASEQEARENPRPLEPPADWEPPAPVEPDAP